MRSIEVSGKSVDEAIFRGLQQLEISIDEVDIEIVKQETRGILGIGAKPAVVRLTEKEPDSIVAMDMKEFARNAGTPSPRRDSERNSRRNSERKDRSTDRNGDRSQHKKAQREARPDVKHDVPETAEAALDAAAAQPAQTPAEAEPVSKPAEKRQENRREPKQEQTAESGEQQADPCEKFSRACKNVEYSREFAEKEEGAKFVEDVIGLMGVSGTVLAGGNEEEIFIKVESDSNGILIGHRGETLDALQYLTSLVVNKNRKANGYRRTTVDTEGYRSKREETLVRLAKKVAAQVKSTGRAKMLEPMNPYERRVLHATLQSNPHVATHSEGDEPNRRVVVTPKRRYRPNQRRKAE